jgi:hypothetical protein
VGQDEAAVTVRFLKERAQAFQREDAELARRRTADQALDDKVVAFLDDCPAGRLEAIDADIAHWDAKCREVEGKQHTTKEALEGLDEADRAADKESTEISNAVHTAESNVDWLDDLILALRDEDSLREILSEEEGRAAKARERASGHADRQVIAAGKEKEHEAAASAAAEEARRYWAEATRLTTGEPAIVPDSAVPLDTLRQNEVGARTALEQRAAQSVLADRVHGLTRQVAEAEAEVARHPDELRRRAENLLAAPDGQEPERRARALQTARGAERGAVAALGAAEGAVSQYREALATIEQQRREPPRRTLPVRPVTASEADDLVSQQETTAQAAGERVTGAEVHIGRIDKSRQEISSRKEQFDTLLDGLPAATQGTSAAEFNGSVDDARTAAREARQRMADAGSRLVKAQEAFTAAIDKLRRTGGDFPKISGPVKDRVMHDPADMLGRNAAGLAVQLRLRASTLEGELASIAKDQGILADSLAGVVRESMETLSKAEQGSRTDTAPGGVGGPESAPHRL